MEPNPTLLAKKEDDLRGKLAERLFEARTVLIHGEINSRLAERVVGQLLALSAQSNEAIDVYVHSQGGHVESGDTIHDVVRFVKPRVRMIGTGWVASAGTHIYLAVDKKDRFCLPNTRFLIHQPSGGIGGQAVDIGIEVDELVKMRRRLNEVISRQAGQPIERVEEDTRRNYWMSPSQALEYGIVGKIVASIDEIS